MGTLHFCLLLFSISCCQNIQQNNLSEQEFLISSTLKKQNYPITGHLCGSGPPSYLLLTFPKIVSFRQIRGPLTQPPPVESRNYNADDNTHTHRRVQFLVCCSPPRLYFRANVVCMSAGESFSFFELSSSSRSKFQ